MRVSCFHSSCYCSLFWQSEDLTEPWPLCQQHEEVVRQTHNEKEKLRLRGEKCVFPLSLSLFWHSTSGHHRGFCALRAPQTVYQWSHCMFVCPPKPHFLFPPRAKWPHSLSELHALMRKTGPIPLIQPLSTDHVGEVWMDKTGCCSIALGQFHAHKRSQGSVKAHSSVNSHPPNPFMLLYQILFCSIWVCVCFIYAHLHAQQSAGDMPDVTAPSWSN